MLTYTFSTREKVLIAALAFALIIIGWYRFVFMGIQERVTAIDSEIAAAQDTLITSQAKVAKLKQMEDANAQYEQQGVKPSLLPTYDNTQNLMAYLNSTLASTKSYKMSFDSPEYSKEDQLVHRVGDISYEVGSYAEARAVAEAIARGPYPCQMDAITIESKDGNKDGTSWSAMAVCTFFEKLPEGVVIEEGDDSAEGQDLSVLINRDK